eukprot:1161592-Pelagomonas_calceolata.AAC.8
MRIPSLLCSRLRSLLSKEEERYLFLFEAFCWRKPEICRIGTKPCWLLSGGALFIVLLIVGSAVELLKDGKCSGAAYRWGTQLSCPRVGNTVELLIDGRWSWGGTKGGEGMRLPEAFRIFV